MTSSLLTKPLPSMVKTMQAMILLSCLQVLRPSRQQPRAAIANVVIVWYHETHAYKVWMLLEPTPSSTEVTQLAIYWPNEFNGHCRCNCLIRFSNRQLICRPSGRFYQAKQSRETNLLPKDFCTSLSYLLLQRMPHIRRH